MQYDPGRDYFLDDIKSSSHIFIGNIISYKEIENKVYFVHYEGYTVLDYKNLTLKQYLNTNKYTKSDLDFFKNYIIPANKTGFGDKWILLKKYDDFTSNEKKIFSELENKK